MVAVRVDRVTMKLSKLFRFGQLGKLEWSVGGLIVESDQHLDTILVYL